jgi:hypothetical protein
MAYFFYRRYRRNVRAQLARLGSAPLRVSKGRDSATYSESELVRA